MARLPKISLIGAGNLAKVLGPTLASHRYIIRQVFSRELSKAKKLSKVLEAEAISDLNEIDTSVDILFLLVPDEAILEVTLQIEAVGINQPLIICHSSGATSIDVFNAVKDTHIHFGIFYPLQSFNRINAVDLKSTPFLIEGQNDQVKRRLNIIARKISNFVIDCDSNNRLIYHFNAVLVNNFVNHLMCQSKTMLEEHKLDPKVLEPIIASTFENMLRHDTCEIQTGPARRNDHKTIRKHKALIKDNASLSKIYLHLTKSIQSFYKD